MEYGELTTFVVVLLAIAGGVSVIGGAVKTIREWFEPATSLAARLNDVEDYLSKDNKRIEELEKAEKLILRALNVQLEHEVCGNHIEKLQEVQNDINEYLINR